MPDFPPIGAIVPLVEPTEEPLTVRGIHQFFMLDGVSVKTATSLTLDYLKRQLTLPTSVIVSDPTGAIPSYETGWCVLALLERGGVEELTLAQKILDEMVKNQYADGSWEQQFYPLRLADGKHAPTVLAGMPYERIQVDSGAGMEAWAMAECDKEIGVGSEIYKTPVRKAYDFLRECQYRHTLAHASNLLANQRWNYPVSTPLWNTPAFAADSAECLLATVPVLDQYGTDLTNTAGYSIKKFANDLYYDLVRKTYLGSWGDPASKEDYRFRTEYPAGAKMWLMPKDVVPQGISYTQALCAWAIYKWAKSAHRDPLIADYSYICKRALNYAIALTSGKWGGFYYHPADYAYGYGIAGDGVGLLDEFPSFTALMVCAMKAVDGTYYADRITGAIDFLRRASVDGGRVFNRVKISGQVDLGEATVVGERYHFRALNTGQALLAGA